MDATIANSAEDVSLGTAPHTKDAINVGMPCRDVILRRAKALRGTLRPHQLTMQLIRIMARYAAHRFPSTASMHPPT